MRFGAPLKPKPNAAVLVAKCRPHSHSTQDIRVGGTLRTSPGARLRAPRTPARTRTFSPLDVVPAVQDLLQQGHQSEGADEDEKQSSVPQQIPVRRGIRVAHPGGRSCAAGRGGRGAPSGPRNHARGSGAPGPRGAHDLPGASWRDQTDGDFSGQSFRWRGQRRGHPSVAGAGAKRRAGLAAGSSAAAPGLTSRWLYPQAPAPGIRRFPCGGATARCPKPGAAPPAEVAANGEQGPGRLPPVRPRASRTAPSGGTRDRGCPAQCPAPADHPIPPAHSEGARRLAFNSASGRWETKHPDSLANDRRVVERGRVERRTPSLNRGI